MNKHKKSYSMLAVNRKNKYASKCGASGGEGAPGFQPGNTCGGDGDGSDTSADQGGGDVKKVSGLNKESRSSLEKFVGYTLSGDEFDGNVENLTEADIQTVMDRAEDLAYNDGLDEHEIEELRELSVELGLGDIAEEAMGVEADTGTGEGGMSPAEEESMEIAEALIAEDTKTDDERISDSQTQRRNQEAVAKHIDPLIQEDGTIDPDDVGGIMSSLEGAGWDEQDAEDLIMDYAEIADTGTGESEYIPNEELLSIGDDMDESISVSDDMEGAGELPSYEDALARDEQRQKDREDEMDAAIEADSDELEKGRNELQSELDEQYEMYEDKDWDTSFLDEQQARIDKMGADAPAMEQATGAGEGWTEEEQAMIDAPKRDDAFLALTQDEKNELVANNPPIRDPENPLEGEGDTEYRDRIHDLATEQLTGAGEGGGETRGDWTSETVQDEVENLEGISFDSKSELKDHLDTLYHFEGEEGEYLAQGYVDDVWDKMQADTGAGEGGEDKLVMLEDSLGQTHNIQTLYDELDGTYVAEFRGGPQERMADGSMRQPLAGTASGATPEEAAQNVLDQMAGSYGVGEAGAGEGGGDVPERSSEIIKDHANFASALYGEDFDHEEKVRLRNSLQKAAESGSAEEDMIASVYEETRDMWGEGKAYDDRHKNIVTSMVKELTDPEFSSYMDLSETEKPAAWELLQADTGAGEDEYTGPGDGPGYGMGKSVGIGSDEIEEFVEDFAGSRDKRLKSIDETDLRTAIKAVHDNFWDEDLEAFDDSKFEETFDSFIEHIQRYEIPLDKNAINKVFNWMVNTGGGMS